MEVGFLALIILATGWVVRSRLVGAIAAVLVGGVVGLFGWSHNVTSNESLSAYRPESDTDGEFRSSKACRPCHPRAYDTWRQTYHRTMTQAATVEAVIGQFDGRELVDGERRFRVFREGDKFLVDMPAYGSSGNVGEARRVVPAVMTTGSHHMQAYWVPVPWFDDEPSPVDRAIFNAKCSQCHGPDGSMGDAGSLVDGYMLGRDVESMFTSKVHPKVVLTADEKSAALRFATRIQYTGRLMQFPFVWLVKHQRWAHEDHTFLQPEEAPAKDEPFGDQWSEGCDQCHALRANFRWTGEMSVGAANTTELGITCESCHGPGRAHIERFRSPLARYAAHLDDDDADYDIIDPADLDHRLSSAVCAQCHAELVVKDDQDHFSPGDPLRKFANVVQYLPTNAPKWLAEALLDEPTMLKDAFWPDGTMRLAGRAYNGMSISGCFTAGTMGCLTCHQLHGAKPNDLLSAAGESEGACIECHPAEADNLEAHSHHAPDSTGSRCYNCHMPHTTVGLLGLIRSHRVDSPSASVTAVSGRPNACNLCHLEKTLGQVAETLTEWYGHAPVEERGDDLEAALSVAQMLRGNAIERATFAWHMGWAPARELSGDHWQARFLAILLEDSYAVVRSIAYEKILTMPGFADFEYDYTGSEEHRAKAVDRAVKRWRSQWTELDAEATPTARLLNAPALFLEHGEIDQSKVDTLCSRRDNTYVRINE